MTSTALLIRHARTAAVGSSLSGRLPHVHLCEGGRAEAGRLRDRLARVPLAAIYSSPMDRARETAAAIAIERSVGVEIVNRLTEIDFGSWTGKTFQELSEDPTWKAYNASRSRTRIPAGEHPLEVQSRIVGLLGDLRERHQGEIVALITHADVIRSAVLFCVARSLDEWSSVTVATASVTAIALDSPLRLLAAEPVYPATSDWTVDCNVSS